MKPIPASAVDVERSDVAATTEKTHHDDAKSPFTIGSFGLEAANSTLPAQRHLDGSFVSKFSLILWIAGARFNPNFNIGKSIELEDIFPRMNTDRESRLLPYRG